MSKQRAGRGATMDDAIELSPEDERSLQKAHKLEMSRVTQAETELFDECDFKDVKKEINDSDRDYFKSPESSDSGDENIDL